jgi:hypothetical protein
MGTSIVYLKKPLRSTLPMPHGQLLLFLLLSLHCWADAAWRRTTSNVCVVILVRVLFLVQPRDLEKSSQTVPVRQASLRTCSILLSPSKWHKEKKYHVCTFQSLGCIMTISELMFGSCIRSDRQELALVPRGIQICCSCSDWIRHLCYCWSVSVKFVLFTHSKKKLYFCVSMKKPKLAKL